MNRPAPVVLSPKEVAWFGVIVDYETRAQGRRLIAAHARGLLDTATDRKLEATFRLMWRTPSQ